MEKINHGFNAWDAWYGLAQSPIHHGVVEQLGASGNPHQQ